jgi:hypothetical protein
LQTRVLSIACLTAVAILGYPIVAHLC